MASSNKSAGRRQTEGTRISARHRFPLLLLILLLKGTFRIWTDDQVDGSFPGRLPCPVQNQTRMQVSRPD